MLLSLVTGSLNRPESLKRLIDSIVTHTDVEWELIIAEASEQPAENIWGERVKILHEQPRLGYVKGYNLAFAAATGKWILYLNDDAEVQPGYAKAAVDFMEANPDVGLGALYYREGANPFRVWTCYGMVYANFGIISRELGNQLGWFDDDLQMYGADNALSFKVLLAGKGIASIPGARVVHYVHEDRFRLDNQKHRMADSQLLQQRYYSRLEDMRVVYDRFRRLSGPEKLSDYQ